MPEAGEAVTRVLLESGQGAPGGRPVAARRAPHAIRNVTGARRSPLLRRNYFTFISSFLIIIIFFPRKAGTQDCPSERCRGRHFPAKAPRASAPGAPEREPEGSARPRTLLRADPGFTAAGGPRLPATPPDLPRRGPPPGLAPFPPPGAPAPFHCQPEAAGAQPGTPKRPCRAPSVPAQPQFQTGPPQWPGAGFPPPSSPQTPHHQEPRSSLVPGQPLHPESLLLPPSSPKMLPALRRPQEFYLFSSNPPFISRGSKLGSLIY